MPGSNLFPLASLTVLMTIAACSTKSSLPDDSHGSTATTAMVDTSVAQVHSDTSGMSGMSATGGMTGDADHDFLRMMSDHHRGMIALAHPAIESKEKLAVKDDARKLDKAQDAEIGTMVAMLDRLYKDSYTPKVTPANQLMVDELKGKSGNDYNRAFLRNVITHHQQAIKMVDEYMPKGKNGDLKAMAAKMKADQTREIAEFEKKLAALK